jgi:hypothetical protein
MRVGGTIMGAGYASFLNEGPISMKKCQKAVRKNEAPRKIHRIELSYAGHLTAQELIRPAAEAPIKREKSAEFI